MVAVNLEQHLGNLQEQSGLGQAEFLDLLDRRFDLLRFFTAEYERLHRKGEVVTVIGSYLDSAVNRRGSVIGYTVPHFGGYGFASSEYLPVDADIAMPEWRRGRLRNSRKREVPLPDDSTLAPWEFYLTPEPALVLLTATAIRLDEEFETWRQLVHKTSNLERALGLVPIDDKMIDARVDNITTLLRNADSFAPLEGLVGAITWTRDFLNGETGPIARLERLATTLIASRMRMMDDPVTVISRPEILPSVRQSDEARALAERRRTYRVTNLMQPVSNHTNTYPEKGETKLQRFALDVLPWHLAWKVSYRIAPFHYLPVDPILGVLVATSGRPILHMFVWGGSSEEYPDARVDDADELQAEYMNRGIDPSVWDGRRPRLDAASIDEYELLATDFLDIVAELDQRALREHRQHRSPTGSAKEVESLPPHATRSHFEELAQQATRDWTQLETLRDVRDLERWRELFFDVHIARHGRVFIPLGLPVVVAKGIISKPFRNEVKMRIGMTFTSRNELRARRSDLTRMTQALQDKGYELHPDEVRKVVDTILEQTPGLGKLLPAHKWMKPVTRFHQHRFGNMLQHEIARAEHVATRSAHAFRRAVEDAIADLQTETAQRVRLERSLLLNDEEVLTRYYATLASSTLFDTLIDEIVHAKAQRSNGGDDLPPRTIELGNHVKGGLEI